LKLPSPDLSKPEEPARSRVKMAAEMPQKKEEIVKAIHEWDIAVALNPDHTKAKSDMEQAKKILKQVEKIK
jgi:hypothetical protein